jgi:hypothetical protein
MVLARYFSPNLAEQLASNPRLMELSAVSGAKARPGYGPRQLHSSR